jgi:deoxyribose-phosphate aldolase
LPEGAADIPAMQFTYEEIAGLIDHSLLQPQLSEAELEEGCRVAARHRVASVCIKPYYVRRAAELLAGSGVALGTTIGFPHGGHATDVKLFESQKALSDGATELDMVVNLGDVLSGKWDEVRNEIGCIVQLAHLKGGLVKVIFENCYLRDEHKIRLCQVCTEADADFVKTSTGYGSGGATIEDLKLMRQHTPPHIGVKAAGGVRDLDAVLAVRALGVTRVGASRTVEILEECKKRLRIADR